MKITPNGFVECSTRPLDTQQGRIIMLMTENEAMTKIKADFIDDMTELLRQLNTIETPAWLFEDLLRHGNTYIDLKREVETGPFLPVEGKYRYQHLATFDRFAIIAFQNEATPSAVGFGVLDCEAKTVLEASVLDIVDWILPEKQRFTDESERVAVLNVMALNTRLMIR